MPEDNEIDWTGVIFGVTFGFGFLVLMTILIVVGVRTWASNKQAAAALARDDAFRKLAESYDSLLQRTAVAQQATAADLAELRGSVTQMEKLMREVG